MILGARRGLRCIIEGLNLCILLRWCIKKNGRHDKGVLCSCQGSLLNRRGWRSTFRLGSFLLALFTPFHSSSFYKLPPLLFCLGGGEKTLPTLFCGLWQRDRNGASEHKIKPLYVVPVAGYQKSIDVDQRQHIVTPQIVQVSGSQGANNLNTSTLLT